jgi:hypothetical protein
LFFTGVKAKCLSTIVPLFDSEQKGLENDVVKVVLAP